jgi:hypothetical protein
MVSNMARTRAVFSSPVGSGGGVPGRRRAISVAGADGVVGGDVRGVDVGGVDVGGGDVGGVGVRVGGQR